MVLVYWRRGLFEWGSCYRIEIPMDHDGIRVKQVSAGLLSSRALVIDRERYLSGWEEITCVVPVDFEVEQNKFILKSLAFQTFFAFVVQYSLYNLIFRQ